MKVRLVFTEGLLGTVSGNPKLAEEYILSKRPAGVAEDEMEALGPEEAVEKTSTVFPREDGAVFLWDYQVKGFFKSACRAMIDMETMTKEELKSLKLTLYSFKRTIDTLIFVEPRKIVLSLPGGKGTSFCERPLRADTMKGERVALARSEEAPPETSCEFRVMSLNKKLLPIVETWLSYGRLSGLGQWRNSGKGRFEWYELKSE